MYLDKRNKDGLTLVHESYKIGKDISNYSFFNFQKTKVYKILTKKLDKQSLDNYFKTFFYLTSFPVSSNIALDNYKKSHASKDIFYINVKYSENKFYLINYLKEKNIPFKEKLFYIDKKKFLFSNLIKFYKSISQTTLKILSKLFTTEDTSKPNPKIGVSFNEGMDINKRSDLFWHDSKKFNKEDVLIYFERRSQVDKYKKEIKFNEILKSRGFNTFDLTRDFLEIEENFSKDIITEIKSVLDTEEEKYLGNISLKLLDNIRYWYSFFKKFNIKINIDSHEMKLSKLEKHIALKVLDACSVGRVRSYITKGVYDFMGTLSTDVNFVTQSDSADRLLNYSFNKSDYVLITGDTNNVFTKKNIEEIEEIKKIIKLNNKKFVILVLDSNYSKNDHMKYQVITEDYFIKYYNIFVDFASKNSEVFLIVKSKRNMYLKKNKEIYEKLLYLKKKKSCYIVENPFGKFPFLYSSIADLTVATASSFPSALLECTSRGKRGIFCDYPNLKSLEKEIYAHEANLIVSNLDRLENTIIKFKDNSLKSSIGDWSQINNMIDSFNDDKGYLRVSSYMYFLLREFKSKASSNVALKSAATFYESKWGKKNILCFKNEFEKNSS